MPIGAHVSIKGGVHNAPARGKRLGCEAIQVFTRGNVRWSFPPLSEEEARAFREAVTKTGVRPVIAHSCYLVNLASRDRAIRRRSFATLLDELRRCDKLGIRDLVMHPGSHPSGPDVATALICQGLNRVLDETPDLKVRILLETTAGMGNHVGSSFDELRSMIDVIQPRRRIGVCVDTCHVFAAGYDIRTEAAYHRTFEELDKVIGLRRVGAIHLNDCKTGLGSHVDRHQHIGRGRIGTKAFRLLLRDSRLRKLPMVIETPKSDDQSDDWDVVNISLLKKLRGSV